MSSPEPAPPPPRRWWLLIPVGILGLVALVLGVAVVRGAWADHEERNPSRPGEVVCRLYQPPQGPWQVRCAMLLDHPPEKVWEVITDYDHFGETFATLKSVTVERLPDGRVRLSGQAYGATGAWPYDIVVNHQTEGDKRVASWEGASGVVQKIKGGWTVTPAGPGRTLLVYSSHVEIEGYPDWFVVDSLLWRQPRVIRAVAARLDRG
jgi:uncharacterized protein YndB with AHSA1/START domain